MAKNKILLDSSISKVIEYQENSKKPLAIILAGHNGSGKSTMWYQHLGVHFRIPLINADRMMLSILPEQAPLPKWAQDLRDKNESWMEVAQKGVESFVAKAMGSQLSFATETVFSHWKDLGNGQFESKIAMIQNLQKNGYFVLLFFVGLGNLQLSLARVISRKNAGGHDVEPSKLKTRFPRTQKAIHFALDVADACILTDNTYGIETAFTPVYVKLQKKIIYDLRKNNKDIPLLINNWMQIVCDGHFL